MLFRSFHTTDYRELLKRPEATAALISTVGHQHVAPTMAALENPNKLALLIEKPIANELAESARVLDAIRGLSVTDISAYLTARGIAPIAGGSPDPVPAEPQGQSGGQTPAGGADSGGAFQMPGKFAGKSAEDIARSCHAHPTLNEAVKEAALGALGRALHVVTVEVLEHHAVGGDDGHFPIVEEYHVARVAQDGRDV